MYVKHLMFTTYLQLPYKLWKKTPNPVYKRYYMNYKKYTKTSLSATHLDKSKLEREKIIMFSQMFHLAYHDQAYFRWHQLKNAWINYNGQEHLTLCIRECFIGKTEIPKKLSIKMLKLSILDIRFYWKSV